MVHPGAAGERRLSKVALLSLSLSHLSSFDTTMGTAVKGTPPPLSLSFSYEEERGCQMAKFDPFLSLDQILQRSVAEP